MPTAESFRSLVVARAGGVCEYCRLVELATGVTFHIDHCVPESRGGATIFDNLALSCPGCNLAKGARLDDPRVSAESAELFNPRRYDPWILGWHLNFELVRNTGVIIARTPVGTATIAALDMNSPSRVFARQLQIRFRLLG